MRVSVLGFGAFGRFAAGHLALTLPPDALCAHDPALPLGPTPLSVTRSGAPAVTVAVPLVPFADAARADVIILAVPVQRLRDTLAQLAPRVTPGALVIDVASVKQHPLAWMAELLRPETDFLGLHPCFGPQSGRAGIADLPIADCGGRLSPARHAQVREFLAGPLGLRVVALSAAEHDRQMAEVQALTHFLSRALGELDLTVWPLATAAYERLLAMRANLQHDSDDLFLAIQRENPYAAAARARLRAALDRVEHHLAASSPPPRSP